MRDLEEGRIDVSSSTWAAVICWPSTVAAVSDADPAGDCASWVGLLVHAPKSPIAAAAATAATAVLRANPTQEPYRLP